MLDNAIHWLLIEESVDGSGEHLTNNIHVCVICQLYTIVMRQLEENEDPSYVVDFWGKSRVSYLVELTYLNNH